MKAENNGFPTDLVWYIARYGPFLYIPKLESYEEACYINNLLKDTQEIIGLPNGTAKVTCLIETYPAIFQTEEIIYGLRDHIAALNCGRWDYLFSVIKSNPDKILPYRNLLTMDKKFMEAYVNQIVYSCHKRGISAIGGMSAFIPTKDPLKNEKILETIFHSIMLPTSCVWSDYTSSSSYNINSRNTIRCT